MVARIDLEPLYTALKAGVGEQWGVYKESITLFMLGKYKNGVQSYMLFLNWSMTALGTCEN